MDLYLYDKDSKRVTLTFENAAGYYADQIVMEDGGICGPLPEGFELSSLADCSETLRADWRMVTPSTESRLADLEELLAGLLYGGEGV